MNMMSDDQRPVSERARRERDARVAGNAPTEVPPCPDWCELPAGHDYDSVGRDEHSFYRRHEHNFADGRVWLDQGESNLRGQVLRSVATINCTAEDDLSVDEARTVAAALVQAADLLEEVAR